MYEIDVTVHDLQKHLDGGTSEEQLAQTFNEDGTGKDTRGYGFAGHSRAWYAFFGNKCPGCAVEPVFKTVNEEKDVKPKTRTRKKKS